MRRTVIVFVLFAVVIFCKQSNDTGGTAKAQSQYRVFLPVIAVTSPSIKRGISLAEWQECSDIETLKVSWFYHWSPWSGCEGDFVPMIKTADKMKEPYFSRAFNQATRTGWLLGFNEPNVLKDYISPQQAAVYWYQIEQQAAMDGIKLVSPVTSPHQSGEVDPYGWRWLFAMVDEYNAAYGKNPHFDAIAVHSYFDDPQDAKAYITTIRQEALRRGYDVPIWVTEYAGEYWAQDPNHIIVMSELSVWFDNTSWIGRYAWFSNRLYIWRDGDYSDVSLVMEDGELTPLGVLYASY